MQEAGAGLRESPDSWREAQLVATETMIRVRRNLERLHDHLVAEGYRISESERVRRPPSPDVSTQLDSIESAIGPVPLSLRAWLEGSAL